MKDFLKQLNVAVDSVKDELISLSTDILNHPEMGNNEFHAAKIQSDFLEKHGFKVTRNFGGKPTAFCGEFGSGTPRIAVFSEFDALPSGHACGHHLITLSALSAAIGLKAVLTAEQLPGTIVLVGSPGEEALGGKIDLLNAGVLDDLDFALITHPFECTNTDPGNLAVGRYDVIYHGKAAHASVAPEEGINALDAQNLFFNGIAFWRQQMPDSARVHGTITDGGGMPNVIPAHTSSFFYVRSTDNATQSKLEARFERMAQGAAMMTDCKLELRKYPNSYAANKPAPQLEAVMRESAVDAGFKLSKITQKISTDFADVTLRCPGVNLMFDVVGTGAVVPLHSADFLHCGSQPFAFAQAMRAGVAVALTAVKLFSNPDLQAKIKQDFEIL